MAGIPFREIFRAQLDKVREDLDRMTALLAATRALGRGKPELARILDELECMHRNALQALVLLGDKLVGRNRQRGKTRLDRGKVILQANREGVSWKRMPSYVLS